MKLTKINIITVLAAALLVAGVIIAGCTQDTGSDSNSVTNSQQALPASTGNSPSSDNVGSQSGSNTGNSPTSGNVGSQTGSYAGNTSNWSHQYRRAEFPYKRFTLPQRSSHPLGVSEQDLKNALIPTSGERLNITVAAQQSLA